MGSLFGNPAFHFYPEKEMPKGRRGKDYKPDRYLNFKFLFNLGNRGLSSYFTLPDTLIQSQSNLFPSQFG